MPAKRYPYRCSHSCAGQSQSSRETPSHVPISLPPIKSLPQTFPLPPLPLHVFLTAIFVTSSFRKSALEDSKSSSAGLDSAVTTAVLLEHDFHIKKEVYHRRSSPLTLFRPPPGLKKPPLTPSWLVTMLAKNHIKHTSVQHSKISTPNCAICRICALPKNGLLPSTKTTEASTFNGPITTKSKERWSRSLQFSKPKARGARKSSLGRLSSKAPLFVSRLHSAPNFANRSLKFTHFVGSTTPVGTSSRLRLESLEPPSATSKTKT